MKVYVVKYHRVDDASWVLSVHATLDGARNKVVSIVERGHYTGLVTQPEIPASTSTVPWKKLTSEWFIQYNDDNLGVIGFEVED